VDFHEIAVRHLRLSLSKHSELGPTDDFFGALTVLQGDNRNILDELHSDENFIEMLVSESYDVASYTGISQFRATEVVAQLVTELLGHESGKDYPFISVNVYTEGISGTWYEDILRWSIHDKLCDHYGIPK
jgi:hypothetical protein